MDTNEIIKLWKELEVVDVHFEFSCGGDSMNDTTIVINGKDGETIENQELNDYFDSEVYNRVEFYVNSDGHYQGEAGTVYITLDEEGEDFDYSKSSQSEWNENIESTITVQLPVGAAELIKAKVLNINGGEGENPNINYKQDCIITDDEEALLNSIGDAIANAASEFTPETDDEVNDWYTYSTNDEGKDIEFNEQGELVFRITNSITTFREDD